MPYPMKRKITKEDVKMFFKLDIDDCKMTRKDFCEVIASFMNEPISTSEFYMSEMNLFFEDRKEQ